MKTNLDIVKKRIADMSIDELIKFCGGDSVNNLLCNFIIGEDMFCGEGYRMLSYPCAQCIKTYLNKTTDSREDIGMHKVKIIIAGDVDGRKEFEMDLTDDEISAIRKIKAAYDNPDIGIVECGNDNTGTPYIDLGLELLD